MSYDLVVWKGPIPASEAELIARLERFDAGEQDAFDADTDVAAFCEELLTSFPPLEDIPEDEIDEPGRSPWSVTPDKSDRLVSLNMVWSHGDELRDDILRLVERHRLALWDPQGGEIYPPGTSFFAES